MRYLASVKSIRVTFDEELLTQLDASAEVRREGRSAVLRRAVADYLARQRDHEIAEAYRRGYAAIPVLDDELEGWAEQGVWPEE
jgi:metal-responsive CopG/Arc/MetJ family transcriptional regulator